MAHTPTEPAAPRAEIESTLVAAIGLQCSVPEGIKQAGLRMQSLPFDWHWSPAKCTHALIDTLLRSGARAATEAVVGGCSRFRYNGDESYTSASDAETEVSLINPVTGWGNSHYQTLPVEEYVEQKTRRFQRLLEALRAPRVRKVLLYADACCPGRNYRIDGVDHGAPASDELVQLRRTLERHGVSNVTIYYYCWHAHVVPRNEPDVIHVPFHHCGHWMQVTDVIRDHLKGLQLLGLHA